MSMDVVVVLVVVAKTPPVPKPQCVLLTCVPARIVTVSPAEQTILLGNELSITS